MNFSKFRKIAAVAALMSCLATTAVFAQVNAETDKAKNTPDTQIEQKRDKDLKELDPVKFLEKKKEKVKSLLKEGKITKEEADEIIAKINEKIKKINEFNKLPLDKKKEKLLSNLKARLEKKVKEGKITKQQMDEIIKEYEKKIKEWDGKGFPKIHCKGCKPKGWHKGKHSRIGRKIE